MAEQTSPLVIDTVSLDWAFENPGTAGIQPEDARVVRNILGRNTDGEGSSYLRKREEWAGQALRNLVLQRRAYLDAKNALPLHGIKPERGGGLLWDLREGDPIVGELPWVKSAVDLARRYAMFAEADAPKPQFADNMFERSWLGKFGYGWGESAKSSLAAEDAVLGSIGGALGAICEDRRLHRETRSVWAAVLQGANVDRLDPGPIARVLFDRLQDVRETVVDNPAVFSVRSISRFRGVQEHFTFVRSRRESDRAGQDPFTYDPSWGRVALPMDSGMSMSGRKVEDVLALEEVLLDPILLRESGNGPNIPFGGPRELYPANSTGVFTLDQIVAVQAGFRHNSLAASRLRLLERVACAAGIEPHDKLSRIIPGRNRVR